MPATRPLIAVIWTGSPAKTLRVRLLSIPHAKHAPVMANPPQGKPVSGRPSHDSNTPPDAMAAITSAILRSKFSRKTNHARRAVRTPSKLSSNEAVVPGVEDNPVISKTGAMTPPKRMDPPSQGTSARINGASACEFFFRSERLPYHASKPLPEPKYKSPASSTGSTCPTSNFAKGVLAPNRPAAAMAHTTPRARIRRSSAISLPVNFQRNRHRYRCQWD